VVLATSALTAELTRQGQRDEGPARGWSRSDTAIVVTLVAIAGLLATVVASGNRPDASRQTAATCFATLYLLLAGYFGLVRRRSLRHR
jgi:hypothetical protein